MADRGSAASAATDYAIADALSRDKVRTCMRYRVHSVDPVAHDALIQRVIAAETARLKSRSSAPTKVALLSHQTLRLMGKPQKILDRGRVVGVEFLRYWRGVPLEVNHSGAASVRDVNSADAVAYDYRNMPLNGMRGARTSCVWGLDGQPGPH